MARKIEVYVKREHDEATAFTFNAAEIFVRDNLLYVTEPQHGREQFFPLDNVLLCKMTVMDEKAGDIELGAA